MWRRRILRYLLPTLAFLVACAFQTTAWPALMGSFMAPPLWILIIAWLSIYRPTSDTILFLYALGILATAFTAMPIKVMLFLILGLHGILHLARSRVFWPGSGYFLIMSVASVAFYHILSILISRFMEPSMAPFMVTDRLLQILLSIPFSVVIYAVMNFLERPFTPDSLAETGGQG